MRQCLLEKGPARRIGWIDVNPSDEGRFVDLKEDGKVDENWYISKVFNPSFSKAWIAARGQDHKNMKKMTDI